MEEMREKTALYAIVGMVSTVSAVLIDHYLFNENLNIFIGMLIGVGPFMIMMFYDFTKTDHKDDGFETSK